MKNSLEKFMNGLIDYAGLFPPAKLPLDEAIDEYIAHFSEEKKWMLGRFIIPISKLNELEKYISKFNEIGTLEPNKDNIPKENAISVADGIAQPFIVPEFPQLIKT